MTKRCERLILHCTYGNLLYNILNEGIIPRKIQMFDIEITLEEAEELAKELTEISGRNINAEQVIKNITFGQSSDLILNFKKMLKEGFIPYTHCILACTEEENILFDSKGEMIILGEIPPENIIGVIELHDGYPELTIPLPFEELAEIKSGKKVLDFEEYKEKERRLEDM